MSAHYNQWTEIEVEVRVRHPGNEARIEVTRMSGGGENLDRDIQRAADQAVAQAQGAVNA